MKEIYAWDRFRTIAMLLASFLVVGFVWQLYVIPGAERVAIEEAQLRELRPNEAQPPSMFTILKDPEQQICTAVMLWCCGLAWFRHRSLRRQRKRLDENPLGMSPGLRILPEDALALERRLAELPKEQQGDVLVIAARRGLQRFSATGAVQDASSAIHNTCESAAMRYDSEIGPLRFGVWAIPALGFIGTVRGIGIALKSAYIAMQGDPTAVTEGLGVAFNSTLVALVLSIGLMYIISELQQIQERLVLDTEAYLDDELVTRLEQFVAR